MGFKFNPFSGNFDQTGSGGGGSSYIDGEVAVYADLSLDAGVAPLNSAWLVREASGVWPVSRKQAGIYIRTATGGSSRDADYTYAGTMPDVFSDSVFLLYDEASTTRTGQFNLGSITAGQNRVLTWPDANGTIARTEDFAAPPAIGSTTRNSGAFTTLNATNGTITASAPALTVSQTWNNSGVTFSALDINVTNTASFGESALIKATIGGTTVFQFRRDYRLLLSPSGSDALIQAGGVDWITGRYNGTTSILAPTIRFNAGNSTILEVGTADTMEMRRTTNPQTFRLYNTFTDASNYERGFMRWNANVLEIGTEGAGTGNTTRELRLFCGTNECIRLQANAVLIRRQTLNINNASITNTSGAEDELGFSLNLRPFSTGNVIINSGLLKFHGVSASFPALKRSSTALQVRLADDSAFAPFQCSTLLGSDNGTVATLGGSGEFRLTSTGQLAFASRGAILMSADGVMRLTNNAGTDFGRLAFGGTSASFPALKRSSTVLQSRLADDSDFAPLQGQLRIHQNAVSETITATHTLTLYDAAGTAYKVPCVAA